MDNRRLTNNAIAYFVDKLYGVYVELGLCKYGNLRADVMAVNRKAEVVLIEVKSCNADLKSDNKLHKYMGYCNKAYLIVTAEHWASHEEYIRSRLPDGMGVIVSAALGLDFKVKAQYRPMPSAVKKDIIIRMAWRSATFSKRTLTRRQINSRSII